MKRWGGAAVGYAGLRRPVELLDGMRVEDVFTSAERVRSSGRTLDHWAGRLAEQAGGAAAPRPAADRDPPRPGRDPAPAHPGLPGRRDLPGRPPPAVHLHADLARRTDPPAASASPSATPAATPWPSPSPPPPPGGRPPRGARLDGAGWSGGGPPGWGGGGRRAFLLPPSGVGRGAWVTWRCGRSWRRSWRPGARGIRRRWRPRWRPMPIPTRGAC
ncbi:hypothetical protein ACFSTC_12185 [Nonomuraea ferruginea]